MNTLIESGALWYASRATGVVSLVLLTAVVLLGILVNRGGRLPGLPRFAVTGLHRNLSLLSVVFLVVHVVSVIIDPYVTIDWMQAILPWGGTYKPLWVGMGAASLDLILALIVTSLVRVRMKQGTWRAIHWLAYAAWPVALAHGIGAGTDLRSGWMMWMTVAMTASVGLAAGWRLALSLAETPRPARVPALMRPPARPTASHPIESAWAAQTRNHAPQPQARTTTGPNR